MSPNLDSSERLEFEGLKRKMERVIPLLGGMLVNVAGQGGDLDDVTSRMAELIELGANVGHVSRHTALTNCCAKGNVPGVALLLSKGADPNQPNGQTETPLHVLSAQGDPEIAMMLLSAGAELDLRDASGATPLEAAEMAANVPLVSVLRSVAARNAAELALSEVLVRSKP